MNVKNQLLKLLLDNRGNFVSGGQIAASLGVSRTSIWKAINALKEEGYEIEAITNKGYCLANNNDILEASEITKLLPNLPFNIKTHKEVTSTNTLLREAAINGASEFSCIIAEYQSAGRGRLGRNFHSPMNTGLYMSILLRPNFKPEEATLLTPLVAVALCQAIETTLNLTPKIKWVNDVFVNNKKVSGILTEAALSLELNTLDYVIIGIGINIYEPTEGFPDELKNIATSLLSEKKDNIRNILTAEILKNIHDLYINFNDKSFINSYKSHSLVIGKEIKYQEKTAKAIDIDENCHLIVKDDLGNINTLKSGEISIKIQ